MPGNNKIIRGRPLIFGEVLFDNFPDGVPVLGGAPFNVAWHLKGFGLDPLFISKIGDDEQGKQVLKTMGVWGMDTSGVQMDAEHRTGSVDITIKNNQPGFNILSNQAYDYILPTSDINNIDNDAGFILYHGSLALREKISHDTLFSLRKKSGAHVFVDINLRPPWWSQRLVKEILNQSLWIKINEQELSEVVKGMGNSDDDINEQSEFLFKKFNLTSLIVTLGEKGAFIVSENGIFRDDPVVVPNLVDTVGAGDAFSAVTLFGLIHDWDEKQVLRRAIQFSAEICTRRGATTTDNNLYQSFVENWP